MTAEMTNIAYGLLAKREHSAAELRNKLKQKEFAEDEIELLLKKLQQANLQSDSRYAESLIRSRVNRGYGPRYIEQELFHKGVCSDTASAVLKEMAIDWFDVANDSYQKKYRLKPIHDDKEKAKRMRFLQYRGFSFDHIMTLIND